MDVHLFQQERQRILQLADGLEHVHVVEPVALGGSLGHYSGEDMEEKASMLAHSDVFLTVYSTMVVEAAVHERPIISLCLDTPGGWNTPRKYSLPLSEIGGWPTHQRFRQSGAGRVALSEAELEHAVNFYLEHPKADLDAIRRFIEQEITYTDGTSGKRTGAYLASLVKRSEP
jgi:CDP-glycerol glycerophosphotransferase (TagB/SpsB family)